MDEKGVKGSFGQTRPNEYLLKSATFIVTCPVLKTGLSSVAVLDLAHYKERRDVPASGGSSRRDNACVASRNCIVDSTFFWFMPGRTMDDGIGFGVGESRTARHQHRDCDQLTVLPGIGDAY